jgi:putative ABC transport system permease protein
VLLGDVLSRTLFNDVPAYLSFAFPVGTQRIVTTTAIVLALAGGIAATQLASILPALDLRSEQPDAILHQAGEAGEAVGRRATVGLAVVGAIVAILSAIASILIPPTTIVAGVLLAVTTLCFIPAGFVAVTRLLASVSSNLPRSMLPLALIELRATATRSIALACVAALAVYGCVAIQGARSDLIRGLDANFSDYLSSADLWITTGGDDLTTNSFTVSPSVLAAIERMPQTASLRTYQGGLLDLDDRRLWIVGRAPDDRDMIPASQLVTGDLPTAAQRLRGTGWATVSEALADARGAQVGDTITLPTPAGTARLRVAAITTNLGWPPGAVILGTTDYRRYWQTTDPSALQVDVKPGASLPVARAAIAAVLRDGAPGLSVQTFEERRAQYAALSRQGLHSLKQIAVLLLIAAGLAVALALSAALWQRRPRLAELKAEGFSRRQLWRCVMLESAVVLALGGVVGALFGLYGHALASRWLQIATGFPAPFSVGPEQVVVTVAALASIALVTMAIPGYIAAAVAPRATFQE